MNVIKIYIFLVCISPIIVVGQDSTDINKQNVQKIQKMLIGFWKYDRTVNQNGEEVEQVVRLRKSHDGSDFVYQAGHPDIVLRKDSTYVKNKGSRFADEGLWHLMSPSEIEFEMVITKDSYRYAMIEKTQQLMDKKWRTDNNGNFLDASVSIINLLKENELRISCEGKYELIFIRH